jgi:hypothetical protein
VRYETKRLVSAWFPLSGQRSDEIKRRDKHVVARLPLFSDAGSIPATSTNLSRPRALSGRALRHTDADGRLENASTRASRKLPHPSLPSTGGFPMTNKMAALFLVTLLAVAFAPLVGRHT